MALYNSIDIVRLILVLMPQPLLIHIWMALIVVSFLVVRNSCKKTRSLSVEYIKVVKPDLNLDDEVKSSVISTMYLAPLSGEYWLK